MARLFGAAEADGVCARRRSAPGRPSSSRGAATCAPLSNGAMLTVVVGADLPQQAGAGARAHEITRTPPDVLARPRGHGVARSRPEAQGRRSRSWCRRCSTGSRRPTPTCPCARTASPRTHGAVRLVFRRGLEYWGVQQTNWPDAPVLDESEPPSGHQRPRLRLLLPRPKLHMIVLRDGERAYWVVNTLLDSLSNETMIAIAKGLQPLDPRRRRRPRRPRRSRSRREPDRRLRSGLRGSRQRRVLRRSRPRRRRSRRRSRADRCAARRARCRSTSRASTT